MLRQTSEQELTEDWLLPELVRKKNEPAINGLSKKTAFLMN